MADEDPANMEVDKHEDVTPAAIPKMKRKQSSGSSGSGSTMDATTALQDRLAALSAMPQRKGRKKKSFDTVENISRSQSVRDRERYYSLADTKKDLNKIVTQRQQKRKATLQARNEEMKKYIKSKRNVLEDDDAKDTQVNADDPALVIKDRQLVKVDDDGDADLATTPLSPPPRKEENSERVMEIDEEKSKTLTSDSQNVVPSSTTASSSETSQTTQTDSTDVNGDEANAKSQSQSQPAKIDPRKSSSSKPVKTPVANPSVNIPMLSQAGSGGGGTSQSNSKRGTGLFRNLFKKKDKEETAAATSSSSSSSSSDELIDVPEPKRLKYQLPNAKGEKFELYTWLKPTKLLGEGAYAAVCEVLDERTGKKYAIKKNRDVFSNTADARRILREIKLMIHFDHPHVMSLTAVIPPESHDRDTYKDCYLIMPRMDTTLSKVIRSKQKLSERHIQYFVYQMVRAMEYMHSGGIIHRDLKPENILVNAVDCKIKITDFGLARGVHIDVDTPQKLTEYVVTRWYRAPEVMCCSRLYDYQIDVWSLGCITAELYTRRPLFKGRNHIEQLQLIFHYMGTPTDLTWITTDDAKKWIAGMQQKPAQDFSKVLPTATPVCQSFIEQLLTINPHKRPTCTESLKHEWLKEFYREKDYRKCPVFNISFEYEASIKTSFGVRHMMYEELHDFHRLCLKKEQQKMQQYQQYKQRQKQPQQ